MTTDLIAVLVGLGLGAAVVIAGLRRDLAGVTREWLPRAGPASEHVTAMAESPVSGERRREYSPRQRRFAIWGYALFSIFNAAMAIDSADGRLLHVFSAIAFAIGALVFVWRGRN